MYLLLLAAFAGCLALTRPSGAHAAGNPPSNGVHVNPSSPAAGEYALPLATARGAPPESGQKGSLFGSGIRRTKAGKSGSNNGTSGQTGRRTGNRTGGRSSGTRDTQQSTSRSAPNHRYKHHQKQASGPSRHQKHAVVAPSTKSPPPRAVATPAARRILHSGSGSSWLWMLVAGAAVLVLGSGGAFVLQHESKFHTE
jgi:hypothetical protein